MLNAYTQERLFGITKWSLFSILLIYILLRAILLDPLHDEVATYIFYFYGGDFWGDNIVWDANNHLLNSLIGWILYHFFGDNFAILRLPNVCAFIIYFFATVRLLRHLRTPYLKTIGLIALNTVPFVLEYFGNARGYGLSLGFLAWSMVYALEHLRAYSVMSLLSTYFFLVLAVSANLTLIITSALIWSVMILYPLFDKRIVLRGSRVREWLLHIGFIVVLLPFIKFGFALRTGGALYYGSLDGIWDITGKSLSKYVLFYDADWLQFAYLLIFLSFIVSLIIILRKTRFVDWLTKPFVLFNLLFFGNLVAALLLASILEVNYPEDRTGMYFVPYFILIIIWLIESFPRIQFLKLTLLFFPITFLFNISIDTSVFSPDDRLNNELYQSVKNNIDSSNSIMIYHILNWTWPYQESHSDEKASVAQFDNHNSILPDVIVTKTTALHNPDIIKLYDTIAHHPPSTHIAFKRKQPLERIPLDTVEQNTLTGNLLYADLGYFDGSQLTGKNVLVSVSGHLKTIAPKNKIHLVVQSFDASGEQVRYFYYSFEATYQSQLIDDDFSHHFILEKVKPEEKEIKVYLWNRALHLIEITDARSTIFELKIPENEPR